MYIKVHGTSGLQEVVEALFYVHRNRRLIRDGSPGGRSPRLSHSSQVLSSDKNYKNSLLSTRTTAVHLSMALGV